MLGRTAVRFTTAVDKPAIGYLVAALSVGAATAARMALELMVDAPLPFATFFPAIMVTALIGGMGPGVAASVATAVVAALFIKLESIDLPPGAALGQLATFAVSAALMVLLSAGLRLAVRRGFQFEQRFRAAQEASRDAFVILTPIRRDGEIVDFRWDYANPAADAMKPTRSDSLVGLTVRSAYPGETNEPMFERLLELHRNGGPDRQEVSRTFNGVTHWMRSSGVRLGDDLAVTFSDITEQRSAEEAVRHSEAQFRSLAGAAPVMIWMADAERRCTWVNQAWIDFTGRPLEDALNMKLGEGVHPDDQEHRRDTAAAGIAAKQPFKTRYRLKRHDGQWRWIDEAAAPRIDQHGVHDGFVGALSDITEIVESRRELEARVAERTRELESSIEERARAEAALAQAQRLETVGRLTGGVAHDFNNLLTVIIGGLDMILRNVTDPVRVRRLGEAALEAGRRGERLNRQLLSFSRNQELKPEVVDAAALLEQVEPLVRRAVDETIELSIEIAAGAGAAKVDPAQFEAALLNLVVNAADATPAGGSIVIAVERLALSDGQVTDAASGDHVRVQVRDTGSGMSPEILGRVFEPFFTTKEVGRGTGLGLAQVYGFARQCGGAVTIDSEVGVGSVVSLYLPAAEGEAAPAVDEGQTVDTGSLDGARILLVEDDDAVRSMAHSLLIEFGALVATDPDGAAARRRLDQGDDFDLLLSDIVMPGGVSGIELATFAAECNTGMAILLMTGYAGERLRGAKASDLAWPVLRKPFRGDQLAHALVQTLAEKRAASPATKERIDP
jgi:PAS domain S-box-containing protein